MTVYIPENTLFPAEARYLAGRDGLTCADAAQGAALSLGCNEPARTLCADKHAAHDFFAAHALPQPHDFPAGSEPFIVKPANNTCGRGIWSTEDFCEAGGGINAGFLVQEELRGPIFSVTLLGFNGQLFVCPAVELVMDDRYDRCGAVYPAAKEPAQAAEALARRLGEALALEGAMELKCVFSGGRTVIVSINEGIGALAATALHFGADCDPIAALLALAEGREPVFGQRGCTVSLSVNGRRCGLRAAEDRTPLHDTDGGAANGSTSLFIKL